MVVIVPTDILLSTCITLSGTTQMVSQVVERLVELGKLGSQKQRTS
jgi:hypothetical protein